MSVLLRLISLLIRGSEVLSAAAVLQGVSLVRVSLAGDCQSEGRNQGHVLPRLLLLELPS